MLEPDLELTILMPCLDEAETVATCVGKACGWLLKNQVQGEVIVADNGSTDGSQKLAQDAGARVVPVQERGYGAALAGGIASARGRFIIMADADDSYDFSQLDAFLEALRSGAHLVMGNRFLGGIKPGAMPKLHYYLGNPVLSGLGRLLFRSNIGDFHCGLRGFRRDAILGLDLRTTGMEFASEMVVKATLKGLVIREVPTTLDVDGRSRAPHLRSWRDGWRHLRFLLMYSPRWLFALPGLGLCVLGALLFAWLIPGRRQLGTVEFDVHTLVAAAGFIVIGYQAVIFGLFTKVFAMTEGLLPEDPFFARAVKKVTLESGLVVGAILFLSGLAGAFYLVWFWKDRAFGHLPLEQSIRVFIPAITLCLIGSQTILASFFLSILGLRRK